jgi:O-antigen/teichoic acid export membrane protein
MNLAFSARRLLPSLPAWTRLWLADSALLLGSQVLTIVATSSAAILVARHLEPRDWGIFSGFLGLSLALSVVIQFGTGTWLLRELSRLFAGVEPVGDASGARLVNAALVLNAALGAVVLTCGVAVAEIRHLDARVTLALAALLVYASLISASHLIETHLRARRRLGRVAAATILEKYLLVTLVVAIAVTGRGVVAIGLAYVTAGIVRLAFVRRSVFAGGRVGRRTPATAEIARVFRGSLPFAFTTACLDVIPKLDPFLLLTLSATSAGYFAIGDRLLGPALIIPVLLSTTLYPFFARRAERLSPPWLLCSVFAAAGGAIAATVVIIAPTFVPLLFGAKYTDAIPAVRVFALALPLVFVIEPLRVFGNSRNQEKSIVAVALCASLVGTVGVVTGQWALGLVGAAAAYVLRQLLFLTGLVFVCMRAGAGGDLGEAARLRAATIEVAS